MSVPSRCLLSIDDVLALRRLGLTAGSPVVGACTYQFAVYSQVGGVRGSPLPPDTQASVRCRAARAAVSRMAERAKAWDGVVSVCFEERILQHDVEVVEYTAYGVTVRREGRRETDRPFTTTLGGCDLALLAAEGFAPRTIVVGVGVQLVSRSGRASSMDQLKAQEAGLQTAWTSARSSLISEMERAGGSGCLSVDFSVHVRDLIGTLGGRRIVVLTWGSAIVGTGAPNPSRPTLTVSLGEDTTPFALDR